jgi:large subunit ribosomal protein L32e
MIENLLEVRKELKERKPVFIRQDNPKRRKLNYKWRKPKGIHSKIRHRFKGRRKMPSPGYKSPRKVKGLHSSGLKIINVHSAGSLNEIKNQSEGIIVARNVGMKKQLEIFKKAKELDIKVLNLNADGQIKKIEDMINSKKKVIKEAKKEEIKKDFKINTK